MQVTETVSEGLKREFKVVVPAADLVAKVDERLDELKGQVRINGFRPGKVPVTHLKRLYGRSAMAETIEAAVREANSRSSPSAASSWCASPRSRCRPKQDAVEQVIEGKSDLAYTVAIEIMPPIELADFKGIQLEQLTAEVTDAEIDEAVKRIAEQSRPFAAKGEGAKAENGDRVVIDFTGKIDGVPFEGGTGGDVTLQIGSGTFIPGFEDQLIGIAAGESRHGQRHLPADLSGAKSRRQEGRVRRHREVDRGADSRSPSTTSSPNRSALNRSPSSTTWSRSALAREHGAMSRQKAQAPAARRARQAAQVRAAAVAWSKTSSTTSGRPSRTTSRRASAPSRTRARPRKRRKDEYRGIAERRVRLGLVIAEIGERNNIKVTDEELTRAVMERARQVPGREQEVWDFYRNNPEALASLRAPIFEDKVIDYILELAKITDKTVSREELYKEDEA